MNASVFILILPLPPAFSHAGPFHKHPHSPHTFQYDDQKQGAHQAPYRALQAPVHADPFSPNHLLPPSTSSSPTTHPAHSPFISHIFFHKPLYLSWCPTPNSTTGPRQVGEGGRWVGRKFTLVCGFCIKLSQLPTTIKTVLLDNEDDFIFQCLLLFLVYWDYIMFPYWAWSKAKNACNQHRAPHRPWG